MNLPATLSQWAKIWTSLSLRQKVSLLSAAVLVCAAVGGFSWWKREQDFKPLFTNMSAEDAGSVVAKLKETGTEYRVAENGTAVLVRTSKVAETRLELASAGLPKTGRIGFELFDKTNLGTTDFAEQVNYRRALEGELERTIKSVSAVEQARVHLTFPKDSVFLESRLPAKASVLLRVAPRTELTPDNISAIRNLVASAVEGLSPDAVSVMDIRGNLLGRPRKSIDGGESSDELIEYRQRIEKDLLEKVNATLQPLLGEGKFRAGVSVECDLSAGEQSDELFDPEKSVMTSSTKTEESVSSGAATAGVPGTSSNLPRSTARTSTNGSANTRRSETIAYQTSKTVRRVHFPRGGVKKLSVAVLVDQTIRWEGQGGQMRRTLVPPSPESLRAIKEVVAAAVGFTPTRGDQLVVETLPFEATLQEPPPAQPSAPAAKPAAPAPWKFSDLDQRRVLGIGAMVVVALMAYVFLRKRRKSQAKRVDVAKALPKGASAPSLDAAKRSEVAGSESQRAIAERTEGQRAQVGRVDALAESIKDNITTDPALAASVLRTWLDERVS